MKTVLSVLVFLACTTACQQWQVISDATEASDVVVVNAALSPSDEQVRVYVGRASTSFGRLQSAAELAISDAEVRIRTGQRAAQMRFSESIKQYVLDTTAWPLVSGETYTIEVKTLTKSIIASCTIPLPIRDFSLEASQQGRFIASSITWQASQPNQVFRLDGYSFYQVEGMPVYTYPNWDFEIAQTFTSTESGQLFRQNNEIRLNLERTLPPFIDAIAILYQYDENAARYISSIRNANDSPKLTSEFFDRFTSPTIRYSNVQNGLGLVYGFQQYTLTKPVRITR
jgi:hypothetical protein